MAPASLLLHEFEDIAKSSSTLGIKLFAKIFALSNLSIFIMNCFKETPPFRMGRN